MTMYDFRMYELGCTMFEVEYINYDVRIMN